MPWKLRSLKIEEEQRQREMGKLEALSITNMRVDASVWRGRAGDM